MAGVRLDKETAKRMGRATVLVEGMSQGGGTGWYRRRFPHGGGSSLRWGEAQSTITAATGWAAADRGAFTIQFYDDAGAADGSPVDGENLYPSSFDNKSVCCVDTKFTPVRLVSVACDLMPE